MPTKVQLQEEVDQLRGQLADPVVQAALRRDWDAVRAAILNQASQAADAQEFLDLLLALRES